MSAYTPEQKQAILAEARALLERTDGERADDTVAPEPAEEPRWPVRSGTVLPTVSCAAMDRWRAEQLELEAERRDERERQQAAEQQQRERDLNETMRRDVSWNRWADRKIAAALEAHGFNELQTDALGMFIAEVRRQLRDELQAAIGELRAELAVRRAYDDGTIIDLPMLPRRHDAA